MVESWGVCCPLERAGGRRRGGGLLLQSEKICSSHRSKIAASYLVRVSYAGSLTPPPTRPRPPMPHRTGLPSPVTDPAAAYLNSFRMLMFFSLSFFMTLETAISKSSCVT